MTTKMETNAELILLTLAKFGQTEGDPKTGHYSLENREIAAATSLSPEEINDAVSLLEDSGLVELTKYLSTAPFDFRDIELTTSGRLFYQKSTSTNQTRRIKMEKSTRDVFVVYGRDTDARDAIFDFLRSVGLNPMEWEEARRLTNKASPYVGEILDAAFERASAVVVLLTGDDEAKLRDRLRGSSEPDYEVNLTPQARPNVLFEAGMALGRSPDHTIIIEIGNMRPFSDVSGRHTIRMKNSFGIRERNAIVDRLRAAGCAVTTDGKTDYLEREYFAKFFASNPQ